MRSSDWSSDVCASDLLVLEPLLQRLDGLVEVPAHRLDVGHELLVGHDDLSPLPRSQGREVVLGDPAADLQPLRCGHDILADQALLQAAVEAALQDRALIRSEEHTSELQSLMRISYAVFCLKTKK